MHRYCPIAPVAEIGVTGLGAEVGQVDLGHGICRADAEDGAGVKRQEPLPRAEHGEGAEKPFAIDHVVPIRHAGGVAVALVRGKVTDPPRACDGLTR